MQELIYNQTEIPKEKWRYGLFSSARTGCGWVAVYNALTLLGEHVDIPKLIRRMELQAPLIHGNTGTLAFAPALMLRHMGYHVTFTANRKQFDEIARNSRVCLVYYYWRDKWKLGAHFVAVRWVDGRFQGYNTFRQSHGPDELGESLEAFLDRCGFFGCMLTAIR